MYYYQWPYGYYYNQPCYYGCQDFSQCQYQQYYVSAVQNPPYGEPPVYESYLENNEFETEHPKMLSIPQGMFVPTKQHMSEKIIDKLEELEEKLEEIEKENEQLKEKVQNLKPIHIENINYKIQELTVEELSGTLNIGLSALTDAENLKKLLEEKGEIKFNDLDTAVMENLEEMEEFNGE